VARAQDLVLVAREVLSKAKAGKIKKKARIDAAESILKIAKAR
jgi:hypothetical protein